MFRELEAEVLDADTAAREAEEIAGLLKAQCPLPTRPGETIFPKSLSG
jgi:hypothetical protein